MNFQKRIIHAWNVNTIPAYLIAPSSKGAPFKIQNSSIICGNDAFQLGKSIIGWAEHQIVWTEKINL